MTEWLISSEALTGWLNNSSKVSSITVPHVWQYNGSKQCFNVFHKWTISLLWNLEYWAPYYIHGDLETKRHFTQPYSEEIAICIFILWQSVKLQIHHINNLLVFKTPYFKWVLFKIPTYKRGSSAAAFAGSKAKASRAAALEEEQVLSTSQKSVCWARSCTKCSREKWVPCKQCPSNNKVINLFSYLTSNSSLTFTYTSLPSSCSLTTYWSVSTDIKLFSYSQPNSADIMLFPRNLSNSTVIELFVCVFFCCCFFKSQ